MLQLIWSKEDIKSEKIWVKKNCEARMCLVWKRYAQAILQKKFGFNKVVYQPSAGVGGGGLCIKFLYYWPWMFRGVRSLRQPQLDHPAWLDIVNSPFEHPLYLRLKDHKKRLMQLYHMRRNRNYFIQTIEKL